MENTVNTYTIPSQDTITRTVWGTILIAFGLFCLICAGSSIGIYYFFFESTIPLDVTVQAGRGTVIILDSDFSETSIRAEARDLPSRPARLSTDSQSQAVLSFPIETAYNDDQLLVTTSLNSNTRLQIVAASKPRFEWGTGRYFIELQDLSGELDVTITGDSTRGFVLQITTTHGEQVHLTGTGAYSISASDTRVHVMVHRGEAVLFPPDSEQARLITTGREGTIYVSRSEPVVSDARPNILENSRFTFDMPASDSTQQPAADNGIVPLPERWGCTSIQQSPPRGTFRADEWANRNALRLLRADGATTNGETRCKQEYADPGYDVSTYNYLELETTFLINYQSISACGVEGSECPMMLRIVYTDGSGAQREWYRGFYYAYDPRFDYYKSRCASCVQDHQRINEKVWYTYRSGNLFTLFAEDARPAYINRVDFYASGHEYDVFVSDIALHTGLTGDAPIPAVPVEGASSTPVPDSAPPSP